MGDSLLTKLCVDWQRWADNAVKDADGREYEYPEWVDLMKEAKLVMQKFSLSEKELSNIEMCWNISEEGEELAEFAKDHIEECWNTLTLLKSSSYWKVRFQVFEVLGYAGEKGESILRDGLNDEDSYCQRRALISLGRLQSSDIKQIAERYVADNDSYMRQVANEILSS